jgi:hypothetical protein
VIWRTFRKSRAADASRDRWWREADAATADPSADALEALRRAASEAAQTADDVEQQEEMIDGLRALSAFRAEPLPVLATQHRAIGADACHLILPVSLAGEHSAPAKLFVTSARLVLVGSTSIAWAWHRIRDAVRRGRDVLVTAAGAADILHVQCNTYGDALLAIDAITRLTRRDPPPV